ncbi:helix-turn-helix transcriptional regulator [Gluconobacter japonicus]|uniref:helix-turn-helix transcriptional regulator n=1 Tax=Gluconobacter japonicus TaxID=376620 RepID=UPI0009EF1806|nr:helix-turn-helix domain-containing protein [Gluconobacter japonicus]
MSELPESVPPAVLTYPQAAEYLGISPGRLRNLKWMRRGPKSVTYGKRDIRFRISDLNEWLDLKAGVTPSPEPARKRPKRPRRGVAPLGVFLALALVALLLWMLGL